MDAKSNDRNIILGALAAIAALQVYLFIAAPIIQAETLYNDAYRNRLGNHEQCNAAQSAAQAWAVLGKLGLFDEWRKRADQDCLMVSIYGR